MAKQNKPKIPIIVPPLSGTKEKAAASTEKARKAEKARKRSRIERLKVTEQISSDVKRRLSYHQEAVKRFLLDRPEYNSKDWRKWTRELGEILGLGDESFLTIRSYIKALQRIAFEKLELQKDKRAKADGKVGPYTVATIAAYMGWGSAIRIEDLVDEGIDETGRLQSESVGATKEYNRKKNIVYSAYRRVLGDRINPESFEDLSPYLMPEINMSQLYNVDYLLGKLYVLAARGIAEGDFENYLTFHEQQRAREYAQKYLGMKGDELPLV